jgi:hypothetical protein
MVNFDDVKKELEYIRYYNARKEMFDKTFEKIGRNKLLDEIQEKYNTIMQNAPLKLQELYNCLYFDCCTHDGAAEKLMYSVNYIYKSNKQMIEFICDYLNKEAA